MGILLTQASRRLVLGGIGQAAFLLTATQAAQATTRATNLAEHPAASKATLSAGALAEFGERLRHAPRRRGFQSVPFVLTSQDMWDHEAASEVLAYRYRSLQMWECTDLMAPWLNLMREAINGQVFSHDNPEFLTVAAIHGTAHLALFEQTAWNKYNLPQLVADNFKANKFISEKPGASPVDDVQDQEGFYGPDNNNIVSLQRRGAVFLGCHDSIFAIARGLHSLPQYSATTANAIAADLTNSLVGGVVLVPSVVAFLVELQRAGFTYTKGD